MKKAKRVRFSDPQVNPSPDRSSDADTLPCDVTKDPPSNDVKTSEYAFFKKFKKDVAHKYQKRPLLKKNSRQRHSNLSNHLEGKMPMKDLQPEMNDERTTSDKAAESSYTSPPFLASKRSDVASTSNGGHESPSYPSPLNTRKIKDSNKIFSSTCYDNPKANNEVFLGSGTSTALMGPGLSSSSVHHEPVNNDQHWFDPEVSYNGTDIFSMKRAKLQTWIKKTLFPHNEEPSERCDLVSLLLKRLLPDCTEINYPETLTPRQKERETEFHLPAMPSPIFVSSRNSAKFEEQQSFDEIMLLKYKGSKVQCNFTGQEHYQPRIGRSLANDERTALLDCGPLQRRHLKHHPLSSQCSQFFDESLVAEIPGSVEAIHGNMNLLEYGGDSRWNSDQGTTLSFSMGFNPAVSFPSKYGNTNLMEHQRRDSRWKLIQGTALNSSMGFDYALDSLIANNGNKNHLEYKRGDSKCKSKHGTALSSSMGFHSALSFPSAHYDNMNLLEYERGDSRWNSNQGTAVNSNMGLNAAFGFQSADYGDMNLLQHERGNFRWNSNQGTTLSCSMGFDSALGFPSANYGSCSPEMFGSPFHDFGHKKESLPLLLDWNGLPTTYRHKNLDALRCPHPSMWELPSYEDHGLERYNPESNDVDPRIQYNPSPLSCTHTPQIKEQGTTLSSSMGFDSALGFPSADYGSCSPEMFGSPFHDFGHKKESLPLLLDWNGLPTTFRHKNLDALRCPHPPMCELPSYEDHGLERYDSESNDVDPRIQYTPSPLSCTHTPQQLILAERHSSFEGPSEGSCFYLLPLSSSMGSLHQRRYPFTSIENIISCSLMNDTNKEYNALQLPPGENYYRSHDLVDVDEL